MAYLKFLHTKDLIPCSVRPTGHIVTLKFPEDVHPVENTSGFHLYLDPLGTMDIGGNDYTGYTTVYRNDDVTAAYNGYQLSNDGSVYIPPDPVPEPGPAPDPTLEDVQEAKVSEMNTIQQAVIQDGVNVTLTDGSVEHFTLTDHDQTSLMGLQSQVIAGEEMIPWHTSDETEHCKFYSNADMALITSAAMACVTWHVTYFRDLRIYIRSLQTREEVQAVSYGIDIPEDYQSEPLKAMIASQNI